MKLGFTVWAIAGRVAVGIEVEISSESIVDSTSMMRLRGAKRDGTRGEGKWRRITCSPRYRVAGSISPNFIQMQEHETQEQFLIKVQKGCLLL